MSENEALQAECDQLFQLARDHERISYNLAHASSGVFQDSPSRVQTPLYLGVDSCGVEEFAEVFSLCNREKLEQLLNRVHIQRESTKKEGQSVAYAHWNNIATMITYAISEIIGRSRRK